MRRIVLSLPGFMALALLAGCYMDPLEQAYRNAPDAIQRINTVTSISSDPYSKLRLRDELSIWRDVISEKERQRWENPTFVLVQFNYAFVYVNKHHPDYEKLRGKHPGDKIELVLTDKASEDILPLWARFARLKK